MKKFLILLISAGFTLTAFAQTSVSGYVYEDANSNGKRDKKEKGIAGIGVSNGTEVAMTDAQGKYTLPVGNDNIIFVIKPANYNLPVAKTQLPLFYYNHKPEGSPASFKYKGVDPTGPLPKSVDFALLPAAENKSFTSLIFGDPQPYTLEEIEYFAKGVVSEVEGIKNVQFGLSLGDLVGDALDLHNPYIQATQKVGIPWFNVMGNHDMNYDAVSDSLSDETFEANFGPANYSFNYGNVHFIILDDIIYPDPRDGKGYWGGFRENQLKFIENDLKLVPKEKLVVLAFHIPLFTEGDEAFNLEHRKHLFTLLKDYEHTLSLSAHTHLQRQNFYDAKDGWLAKKPHHEYNVGTTSGDWYSGAFNAKGIPVSTMRDGTPKGYAFIHFNDNQYTIDYKVVDKDSSYQVDIYSPNTLSGSKPGSARVYANFFMGHEKSELEIKFGKGGWKKMKYVETIDPGYTAAMVEWDKATKLTGNRRPSLPSNSTHLYEAVFPKNMKPGKYTIEVKAKDMFGRTFTAKKDVTVQ
ncbi:calcineurin-like phosphoesterase C-terminal domain-containing protein [Polluticaenibacter yanchengensis]|uniref:Calcineurin-like phosphoesterase family protein n=1 Tax=Polluticaenibacter yanchengensis TaxID=3014562 RepID=A0ABT4UJA8_9BACT|nr:calcineurin-like phosphoesterase family protein [Chitinophagaceae bacterium LY-5]